MPVAAIRVKSNDLDDFYQILINFSNRSLYVLGFQAAVSVLQKLKISPKQFPVGVEILEKMFYNRPKRSNYQKENPMSKRNVVHIEIPATDIPVASKFYQELFGWKMQHSEEFDYTMWEDGSGYGGGFNKASDENPAGQVLVYVHSDDIEADLKKVEKLGGTVVHPKTEIPGTGWFGQFKDPTGNVIALYTSQNPEFNQ